MTERGRMKAYAVAAVAISLAYLSTGSMRRPGDREPLAAPAAAGAAPAVMASVSAIPAAVPRAREAPAGDERPPVPPLSTPEVVELRRYLATVPEAGGVANPFRPFDNPPESPSPGSDRRRVQSSERSVR